MANNVKFSNTGKNPRRVHSEDGKNVLINPGETKDVSLSDNEFAAYKREQENETLKMGGAGAHESKEMKEVRERVRADVKKDAAERAKDERVKTHEEGGRHRARE